MTRATVECLKSTLRFVKNYSRNYMGGGRSVASVSLYTIPGTPSLEWVLVSNYWLARLMEPHGVIGNTLIIRSEILGSNTK